MNDTPFTSDTPEEGGPHIIDSHGEATHGQNKCPQCGASEIGLNIASGQLRCNFCRFEFEPVIASGIEHDLEQLSGCRVGSGAQDIAAEAENVVTLKCQSCGAEVVISTEESLQARCHWCRNTLSLNHSVPNGAVPDVILPFKLTKAESQDKVNEFIKARWFYADKTFRREFTAENIFGVYLPYMVVDINTHMYFEGEGEILKRKYTVTKGSGSGKRTETYYDADFYSLYREFDITISDLTIEASQDKLDHQSSSNTKNVINTILPFDTENALQWNANYLRGFHSEKRDLNVDCVRQTVYRQAYDIAAEQLRDTIGKYDRGVLWNGKRQDVKGEQWVAALLPVWLYSYQKEAQGKLYYTAVNARTGETMGSVPINYLRLALVVGILFLLTLIPAFLAPDEELTYFLLIIAPCYGVYVYYNYSNQDKRHEHETDTASTKKNVVVNDSFIKTRTKLKNSKMKNATHFPR